MGSLLAALTYSLYNTIFVCGYMWPYVERWQPSCDHEVASVRSSQEAEYDRWKKGTMSLVTSMNCKNLPQGQTMSGLVKQKIPSSLSRCQIDFLLFASECILIDMSSHLRFPHSILHRARLLMHIELEKMISCPATSMHKLSHSHFHFTLSHNQFSFVLGQLPVLRCLFSPLSLCGNGALIFDHSNMRAGTSPVVQWLRISCQCRGHRFGPWSGKIPHAMEQLSLCATATEARAPRAHAPQQETPLQ